MQSISQTYDRIVADAARRPTSNKKVARALTRWACEVPNFEPREAARLLDARAGRIARNVERCYRAGARIPDDMDAFAHSIARETLRKWADWLEQAVEDGKGQAA